jgi:hypothetical protein
MDGYTYIGKISEIELLSARKRIMIKPATILNSSPKKINTLPMKEAAIPRDIKTTENPREKTIVLSKTTLLLF